MQTKDIKKNDADLVTSTFVWVSKAKVYAMLTRENLAGASLVLLCLFYIIMLGGGNYEQMNVSKVLVSAPPKSFAMLTGEYRFNPVAFWVTFRPLTILLFIISLILNWNISPMKRKILLVCFSLDILVTIATFLYFAPEIGSMMSVPMSDEVDSDLMARATRWHRLNYVRLGTFYLVAILLLIGLKDHARKAVA